MKNSKLLSLVLILCMFAALFSACSAKPVKNDTPSSDLQSSDPSIAGNASDELTTVNVWLCDIGGAGAGGNKWTLVNDAINEYTEKNLNISVNFTWVQISDFATQFSLAVANKEPIDIAFTGPVPPGTFSQFYSSGMAMDISGYLDEYGQDIKDLMADMRLLDAYTMPDGKVYGIPAYRMLNSNNYICYRTDMLEEVGMVDFFNAMTTWSEFEEVIKAVAETGLTYGMGSKSNNYGADGYCRGAEAFADSYVYDTLGDSTGMVYTDQAGNVSLSFENDDILAQYKRTADWYSKGYFYPDSYIASDMSESLIANNTFAGYVVRSEYGVEVNKSQSCQTDMTCIEITPGMISTASTVGIGVIVPIVATEPEAAIRLLSAFYTTPELMNLINWGVEGETYVMTDSGEATYPENTDNSTCGYHYMDFMFGNQFISAPWIGAADGAAFRENSMANFLNAGSSVYMGLAVDVSEMDTIISSIAAVRDEYVPILCGGMFSDSLYNEFLAKVESAGVDKYLDFFQTAVDDFMA